MDSKRLFESQLSENNQIYTEKLIIQFISLKNYKMEDFIQTKSKLETRLNKDQDILKASAKQVWAHCREDHMLSSSNEQWKHRSIYKTNFSPPKLLSNYDIPLAQKQLPKFRRHQTSALLLPSILSSSQYQTAFRDQEQRVAVRSKQRQSWFGKNQWALKPISDYKEHFKGSSGNQFNQVNKLRLTASNLNLLRPNQLESSTSVYVKEFKTHCLPKQQKLSIRDKDHLSGKENSSLETGQSEYQRRYDSVWQFEKPKKTTASLYKNDKIICRKKVQLE